MTTHTRVYLTKGDVARLIERTPANVARLAREGKLPVAAITPGGTRLFRLDAVEAYRRTRDEAAR